MVSRSTSRSLYTAVAYGYVVAYVVYQYICRITEFTCLDSDIFYCNIVGAVDGEYAEVFALKFRQNVFVILYRYILRVAAFRLYGNSVFGRSSRYVRYYNCLVVYAVYDFKYHFAVDTAFHSIDSSFDSRIVCRSVADSVCTAESSYYITRSGSGSTWSNPLRTCLYGVEFCSYCVAYRCRRRCVVHEPELIYTLFDDSRRAVDTKHGSVVVGILVVCDETVVNPRRVESYFRYIGSDVVATCCREVERRYIERIAFAFDRYVYLQHLFLCSFQ